MNRGFLRWFYLAVQFVMLAVSIPKVATLFHAYNLQTLGPLVGDIDLRSWLVGIAIDLTATFTTWAAMHRYEESRKHLSLFAPAFIILVCTGLSVVANYEDAARLAPQQYADVSLFTQPALLVNPLLISMPPVLVFLLIVLVPSVLAQPRLKSAAEIEAETEEQEALIASKGRKRVAKARANAQVRGAHLQGFAEAFRVMTSAPKEETVRTLIEEERAPDSEDERASDPSTPVLTRAMWNALSLRERVLQSGLINAHEVAEVLGVGVPHARKLLKDVRIPVAAKRAFPGRSGVSYLPLIDALYQRRTRESFAQAHKLEMALGLRRKARQVQLPDEEESTS